MLKIAVVIPCYKVKDHILNVLMNLPESIQNIYIVDEIPVGATGKIQRIGLAKKLGIE